MSRRYQLTYTDEPVGKVLRISESGKLRLQFANLKACEVAFVVWSSFTEIKEADAFADGLCTMYLLAAEETGLITVEGAGRTH